MPKPVNTLICSADGCNKLQYAKGYCRQHWHRLKTYGRLNKIVGLIKGNCTVEGCNEKIKGLGLCKNHYQFYKLYNIHPNDYNNKLKEQNFVCAICEKPETSLFRNTPGKVKKLSQDHDHKTGKMRGLLCSRCNHFLGRVNEDLNLIQSMIDYLNKHKD